MFTVGDTSVFVNDAEFLEETLLSLAEPKVQVRNSSSCFPFSGLRFRFSLCQGSGRKEEGVQHNHEGFVPRGAAVDLDRPDWNLNAGTEPQPPLYPCRAGCQRVPLDTPSAAGGGGWDRTACPLCSPTPPGERALLSETAKLGFFHAL